jgi:hypothetical protein
MNGFHIVRISTEERTTSVPPGVYLFLVRDPQGQEQEVAVQVDASAVAMVEHLLRRPLPLSSSFWQSYAEHTLATYVWDEGRLPSLPLTITQVERREVDLAARWDETVR